MAIEQLRTLFEHSFWARDRLLGVVQTLDDAALREVPESGAYGSVFDTLVHMAVSEWMWVQRCTGESPLRIPKGEDFANLRVLIDWWTQIHATSMEFLDKVAPAGLEEQVTYMGPDGNTRTRKVWHMLLQVPNHQTEHRAQLGTLLGQRGVETPAMDLVVFLSEKQA
jgi:uncharacterized damage-inducible protein DinB